MHADHLILLLEAGDIDPVRQLNHELMQQMHRQVAVRLQILDRLLARAQGRDFIFQAGDLTDLLFQHLDLRVQQAVFLLLGGDQVLQQRIDQAGNDQAGHERQQHRRLEQLLAALACRFAVGK
ncbi:hypothetical protein D3C85_1508500 [compost metagenome]